MPVEQFLGAEQLAAMNPPERAIARDVIKDMKLPDDRQKKLLEVLGPH